MAGYPKSPARGISSARREKHKSLEVRGNRDDTGRATEKNTVSTLHPQLTSLRRPDEQVMHHAEVLDRVRSLARSCHSSITLLLEQTVMRSEHGLRETVTVNREGDDIYEQTERQEYDILYREQLTVRLRSWALFSDADGGRRASRTTGYRLRYARSTRLRRIVRRHMRRRLMKKEELTRSQEQRLFGDGKEWVYGRSSGERVDAGSLTVRVRTEGVPYVHAQTAPHRPAGIAADAGARDVREG